jgi:molybdopterin synthase sulfur carrier subunit
MRVVVRYFGIASEYAGKREQAFDVEPGMRLSGLKEKIFAEHPRLTGIKPALLFAVRSEVVDDADLQEGDEVAILPPVSGG